MQIYAILSYFADAYVLAHTTSSCARLNFLIDELILCRSSEPFPPTFASRRVEGMLFTPSGT